jgi:hypothetical protein
MLKRLALLTLGLLLGVIIGVACTYAIMQRSNHQWMELTKENHGIAYSGDVFTEADILIPDMKDPHGQAKFVDRGVGKGTELGFLVKASMDKLDTNKLPEKYKKERQWGKLTLSPTESVTYNTHLEFTLKDADSFTLITTKSEPAYISSGQENTLQGFAKDTIPDALVQRTKSIVMSLVLDKCETCRP